MSPHTRKLQAWRAPLVALAAAAGLVALAGCGGQTPGAAPLRAGNSFASHGSSSRPGSYRLLSSANVSPDGSQSGVSGGALFGGDYPLLPYEADLGRTLAIVRLYYFIGDAFPGAYKFGQLMAGGRTLLVSLDSNGASYASIAAGNEDAEITAFLESVNKAAVLHHLGAIYICFEHEPDNDAHRPLGSPAQFVQAWDHVHQLAESARLDWNDGGRLHWVFILIHTSYENWRASSFWPGAGEVDIVAADGYNSYGCRTASQAEAATARGTAPVTPASLFNPLVSFASAHGDLPVFLSEWGSDSIPSDAQSEFISQMQTYVTDQPEIAAALYWNTGGHCSYKINDHPASIAAMATMGQSAALQGHIATIPG
jgi:hypothetical protein